MERMTSLELVTWTLEGSALPAELHPRILRDEPSAMPGSSRGELSKSVCRRRSDVGSAIRRSRAGADAQAVSRKRKSPEPWRIRASGQRFEGARLCAALARMHPPIAPTGSPDAGTTSSRRNPVRGDAARPRRRSPHEREPALQGAAGFDEVAGFHDEPAERALDERTRRTVNSLYGAVNPRRQSRSILRTAQTQVADLTITRRRNVQVLFQAYAEKALAGGVSPKGLEQSFAATLQISPSMWSQIKSSRSIGDKLARQIERHQGRSAGWLDEARENDAVAPAEKAFLDLALKAWRATNGAGRKALRDRMKTVAAARSE